MRALVCIAYYGTSKAYARQAFDASFTKVLGASEHEIDVMWVTDQEGPAPDYVDFLEGGTPGLTYSDDMLPEAHDKSLKFAKAFEYDKLVWQGVDMLYHNPNDLDVLLESNAQIVSALVAARTDSQKAVARRFVCEDGYFTGEQYDIPTKEFVYPTATHHLIPAGYPSSDNLVIDKRAFGIRIPGFVPWHRKAPDEIPLCYEEEWCLKAVRSGFQPAINLNVRPWHVHDVDLVARQYPGKEMPLKDWMVYYGFASPSVP